LNTLVSQFKNTTSVRVMVFNAIFNNCSVISWHSALLVEETGENQRPVAKSMTNYHVLYRVRAFENGN